MEFRDTEVWGFKHGLRGMRNAMESWEKSDSGICKGGDDGIGVDTTALSKNVMKYGDVSKATELWDSSVKEIKIYDKNVFYK